MNEQDRLELENWRNASPQNEELFHRLCSEPLWRQGISRMASFDDEKGWEKVMQKARRNLNPTPVPSRSWKKWWGVAAAVLLCLGGGTLAWLKMADTVRDVTIVGAKDAIRLNTDAGQAFLLDSAGRIEMGKTVMENTGRQLRVYTAETSGAADVSGTAPSSETSAPAEAPLRWNTLETPRGADYSLILSDGSEIFLNAETVLRFPDCFRSSGNREVWVKGEAYFKIRRDTSRPFIVHSGRTSVRVLGTEFNVMAYTGDTEWQVTLLSGKVEVANRATGDAVLLHPGLQAVYDRQQQTLRRRKVDVSYYTAWHNGIFAFRETPLRQVMETLARWYDFDIFFRNKQAEEYIYTGKIKRHATLREVLENFRQTREFDIEINGKTVIIK